MKREAYGKITDPRNISTFPPLVKLDYSRFIYAVTDYMKGKPQFSWYAFGRTPIEIAGAVARICENSFEVLVSDYSRMDGRKSNISRLVFRTFCMRLFKPKYHSELDELLKLQFNRIGYTKHGVKYDSGYTQASGGVDTSVSNTLDCAFGAYLGSRYSGMPPVGAQDFLVNRFMAGGDDAIMGDISAARVGAAARTVGHKLTFEIYTRGNPGVNFLSRIYSPQVWFGSPVSMCDIRRQLMKFHVTPIRGVDYTLPSNCLTKLREKCVSFYMTDRLTPVIGQFCTKVVDRLGKGPDDVGPKSERWWSRFSHDVQFPQDNGDWMLDVLNDTIPNLYLPPFYDWLNMDIKEDEELLHPPRINDTFLEFSPVEDCVVNDRVGEMTNENSFSLLRTVSPHVVIDSVQDISEGVSQLSLEDQQSSPMAVDHAPNNRRKRRPKKAPTSKRNPKRRGKGKSRQTKRSAKGRPDQDHA
jgi:hypothetical protein